MAKKSTSKSSRLAPGTLCLIRSIDCPEHSGKVVVVEHYDVSIDAYECSPELLDREGEEIAWDRSALIPLPGGQGQDEILRLVGVPCQREEVRNDAI
jgi:hypothetical protein